MSMRCVQVAQQLRAMWIWRLQQLCSVMQTCGQDTQAAGMNARRQLVYRSQDDCAEVVS
jgi:hypothetical protein